MVAAPQALPVLFDVCHSLKGGLQLHVPLRQLGQVGVPKPGFAQRLSNLSTSPCQKLDFMKAPAHCHPQAPCVTNISMEAHRRRACQPVEGECEAPHLLCALLRYPHLAPHHTHCCNSC